MIESNSGSPPKTASGQGPIGFVFSLIPTILVFSLVAGIGWWGHNHGWKLPKFASLKGQPASKDDWCAEHSVPESICVECNESLLPRQKSHGWCKIHGVHECPLCHPEVAQLDKPPKVGAEALARAKRALEFIDRPANSSLCSLNHRRIQFADKAAVERAGITDDVVWTAPITEYVTAPGEITYDQTRVAHISARSAGTVWKIFKRLGDEVKTGDIVALVDATEVGKTKSELLQAFVNVQLKEQLLASLKDTAGAVPAVRIREAEAGLREAEIRLNAARQTLVNLGLVLDQSEVQNVKAEELEAKLHFLGIPVDTTKSLDKKKVTSNLLPVVAPMNGIITSGDFVAGEATDTTRILFEIVDTKFLWINFDVKGEDATRIKLGQPVRFKPDNGREELTGKISWRSSQADLKTRTIRVRAELADPERSQAANTFGSGKIILREEPQAIVVPSAAVHWEGCCHVVFVRDKDFLKEGSPKVFHTRKVRIGAKDDKNTEIIAGVLPGELVAVKNSGVLRAELLRGNLGEG